LTAAPATGTKRKLFYGWKVLGVSVAAAFLASITAQLFTGALLPYIEDDTGWSRSSITLAVTLGSVAGGLISPFFGRLADIYGPRVLSAVGLLITVASLFLLDFSGQVHVLLFGLAYVIGRATAQNTLSGVVPRTTAVNWFRRMRGRALGMTSMAVPLGGAALIPVAQLMIGQGAGWETVYYFFGALLLFTMLPPVWLVLKRRPEDMGLLPDGDEPGEVARAAEQRRVAGIVDEYNWTLREAVRTRTLWLMIVAMSIGICANGAIGFHQFAYFKDQGIAAGAAALALSSYALSGAFANALWGLVIERLNERVLGALTVTGAGILSFFLLTVDTPAEAMIFAVLFGLTARGESSIITMMEAQYFGRAAFGTISGFSTPFQQIALGLGPTIAAVVYDISSSSYDLAFMAFGVMYVLSAVLIWYAKKPVPPLPAGAAI
jgi:sugar phosphate permease